MLNRENLEQLLVKNWTSVLDNKALLSLVLREAARSTFNIVRSDRFLEGNSFRVSVSRFELTDRGFVVWADFTIPRGGGADIGTAEILLRTDGTAEVGRVTGQRFTPAEPPSGGPE